MRCIFFYILFKKLQKKIYNNKKIYDNTLIYDNTIINIIIKIKNYKKILKFDYIFII